MKRHITWLTILAVSVAVLAGGCATVLYFLAPGPFWVPIALLAVCVISLIVLLMHVKDLLTDWLKRLAIALDPEQQAALHRFPIPALLLDEDGAVLFANDLFVRHILDGETPVYGTPVVDLFEQLTTEVLDDKKMVDLSLGERKYSAYISVIVTKNERHYVVYFIDDTDLKDIAEEYAASRPVVLSMTVDNLKDVTSHLTSGIRTQIIGRIENLVEDMASAGGGLCQKYDNDYYVVVTEQRHLQWLIEHKFPILQEIHDVCSESERFLTISIGVGADKTIAECRKMADASLEIAVNRGGGLAVIPRWDGGYDFVGGHTQAVKRRNKIQSRTRAMDLVRFINESDRVFIMGHRSPDLDSVGSAIALASTIRKCGCEAYVCINQDYTDAEKPFEETSKRLIEYFIANNRGDLFISSKKVPAMKSENSLFIVVDNQTEGRLDDPSLLEKFQRTVVIDHHPKQDSQKSALIVPSLMLFLDNDASSTCELVTEMIPYMCEEEVDRMEAEALLSGIILDTQNFTISTGDLTFEAAAYLRSRGADIATVKKLYMESAEFYQLKSGLIATAERYRDMVIAASDSDYEKHSAAAAQAADELQWWPDVRASFAVVRLRDRYKVFARSLDGCSVSLIMKEMGGDGHNRAAAVELKVASLDAMREMLKAAIAKVYYREKPAE